MKKIRY